ncbi:MAG: hypothetical protein WCK91_00775 [bacterium]
MDKKTSVLIIIILVATTVSIFFLYRKSYITKDFEIEQQQSSLDSNNT